MSNLDFSKCEPRTDMTVAEAIQYAADMLTPLKEVASFEVIGSASYLPDPADVDVLVLMAEGFDALVFASDLGNTGWGNCGNYDMMEGSWAAVRRETLNLIVTHDKRFYDAFIAATEVCKALHLTDKADRIAVCGIVRDGKKAADYKTSKDFS